MSDEPNGIAYPMPLFDHIKVGTINGIPADQFTALYFGVPKDIIENGVMKPCPNERFRICKDQTE